MAFRTEYFTRLYRKHRAGDAGVYNSNLQSGAQTSTEFIPRSTRYWKIQSHRSHRSMLYTGRIALRQPPKCHSNGRRHRRGHSEEQAAAHRCERQDGSSGHHRQACRPTCQHDCNASLPFQRTCLSAPKTLFACIACNMQPQPQPQRQRVSQPAIPFAIRLREVSLWPIRWKSAADDSSQCTVTIDLASARRIQLVAPTIQPSMTHDHEEPCTCREQRSERRCRLIREIRDAFRRAYPNLSPYFSAQVTS